MPQLASKAKRLQSVLDKLNLELGMLFRTPFSQKSMQISYKTDFNNQQKSTQHEHRHQLKCKQAILPLKAAYQNKKT